jgi:hypothetical protein
MIDVDVAPAILRTQPITAACVQWFDLPGEARGADGDLTDITYKWMLALTHDVDVAEHLTLDVFIRAQQPLDDWLLAQPTLTRLKILCGTVFVQHGREGGSCRCAAAAALSGKSSSVV